MPQINNRCSSFKFQQICLRRHDFIQVIESSWKQPSLGFGMYKLVGKLKRLRTALSTWNREVFGNVFTNVRQAEEVAKNEEEKYDNNPNALN